jgi:uncharacterized protein YdhG (YjbR/CyaY superfamily)
MASHFTLKLSLLPSGSIKNFSNLKHTKFYDMKANATPAETVDQYIAGFPKSTQVLLKQLRATIKKAAPKADEMISYMMPAYKYHGALVYFGGYEHHIGFYPGAAGVANFEKEIAGYKSAKGSIQFPLDQPLPLKLITKIVTFRVRENQKKAELKKVVNKKVLKKTTKKQ